MAGSPANAVRQEMELIVARGRILQLEDQLAQEQSSRKRARLEDSVSFSTEVSTANRERLDKLEVERYQLLEEMASLKDQLSAAKKETITTKEEGSEAAANAEKTIKDLRAQLEHTDYQLTQAQEECSELKAELDSLELEHTTGLIEELEELQQQHARTVESLQARLKSADSAISQRNAAQERVRELEGVVRRLREKGHLVETCQERLAQCEELERQCRALTIENEALSSMRDNQHLLRYKLSVLEDQCKHAKKLEEDVARLSLENEGLKERLAQKDCTTEGPSLALMEYRLSRLQCREKVLEVELGGLRSDLSLAENATKLVNQDLSLYKDKLTQEQEKSKAKDEKIQKLEKRLKFLAKEREGCMNVLKSYTVDTGSDGVLRAALAELGEQLASANRRTDELQEELDTLQKKQRSQLTATT